MFVAGVASAEECTLLSTDQSCAECVGGQLAVGLACFGATAGQACPAGVQDQIDAMYAACDGKSFADEDGTATWEQEKPEIKAHVEACGCGGAAQAAPLFAALAAIVNHFLN